MSIQRSQKGLLRTLLHSLLCQIPNLMASVCGERWNDSDTFTLSRHHWSQVELEALLHRIPQLPNLPVKFAFFVNGLHEFEGDGRFSITQLMHDLGRYKNIKLCVSSRPWNLFENGFGRDPAHKLYIHELTKPDILNYATSRLSEHPRWLRNSSCDLKLMASLAAEITKRARGVFLWVFLVTRLLSEEISNYNSVIDLWKRLKNIPVDLKRFFKHILQSIKPFYYKKMAGALLIALKAGDPLPINIYRFYELEYSDEEYALKQQIRCTTGQKLKPLNRLTSRRLNG